MSSERFFDSPLVKTVEKFLFRSPESVGTIRIKKVSADNDDFPGFDIVELDFGDIPEKDKSPTVYRIPEGFVKEGQIAEVLVRKASALSFNSLENTLFGTPRTWLTAIRPYSAGTYGKVGNLDTNVDSIFVPNIKDSAVDEAFYKRFIEDRTPKIPGTIVG
jgi:hypothetical protein